MHCQERNFKAPCNIYHGTSSPAGRDDRFVAINVISGYVNGTHSTVKYGSNIKVAF